MSDPEGGEHPPTPMRIAERFAAALDHEEYSAATALLDASCMYAIRGEVHRGPGAIIDSYRGNGDTAARVFDEINYHSEVIAGEDGWVIITFSDHIRHVGLTLDHTCEQWVRVNAGGLVVRIEHHDLPGERERLEAFKRDAGV